MRTSEALRHECMRYSDAKSRLSRASDVTRWQYGRYLTSWRIVGELMDTDRTAIKSLQVLYWFAIMHYRKPR
eukprot:364373-Chlamydomonas_euryale.AAC.4